MRPGKSFRRILAMANKEWLQVRRDTRSLILSVVAPIVLIILFGYALSVDVKNVSTAIYDQDRSTFSRQFLDEFSHTEYITIEHYVNDYREIDNLIDSGRIRMALVIPRDFEKRYKAGKKTDVQLIADGSDSTSAMVATGYVRAIVANFNMEVKIDELKRIGISRARMPVEIKTRVWYNPELLSKNFIIPGLIVLILAIISALIASLTISREWERGTMETLITTPVRRYEIVFGKIIPYLVIGLFDVILTIFAGYFIFNIPVRGSFVELYLLSLLFLTGTTSMGIMISSATRVQVLSVQIAMVLTYIPSFILSGFVFPIKNMPAVLQGITYLVPARYLIVILKGIALKGVSMTLLWAQILFLFLFALLVISVSIKKMTLKLPEV